MNVCYCNYFINVQGFVITITNIHIVHFLAFLQGISDPALSAYKMNYNITDTFYNGYGEFYQIIALGLYDTGELLVIYFSTCLQMSFCFCVNMDDMNSTISNRSFDYF